MSVNAENYNDNNSVFIRGKTGIIHQLFQHIFVENFLNT